MTSRSQVPKAAVPHRLAYLLEALALRLPGAWDHQVVDLTARGPRDDVGERLWDLGIAQWAVEVFVHPSAGRLLGPDRQELLVLTAPRSSGRSIIVAPLIPAVFGTAYEHDDLTPFGITAPAEPTRAAALIKRRLLPRYADALAAVTSREIAAYTPTLQELAGDLSAGALALPARDPAEPALCSPLAVERAAAASSRSSVGCGPPSETAHLGAQVHSPPDEGHAHGSQRPGRSR
ncbi:hypothetical protein [Streptacidiphilus sp. MAP5-52]|uniref:hypothetical protein n=1 Tax=Streptacidiphilus sp. MAP5-52 TaxID=3156267 RepID=UPI003511D942